MHQKEEVKWVCGTTADIVASSQPWRPIIEPGSFSLSFHCSLASTAPVNKGCGVWCVFVRLGGGGGYIQA